jgi:hypothetical protein
VPDIVLPSYDTLHDQVLRHLMQRRPGAWLGLDAGHDNPDIGFRRELLGTSMLWAPDRAEDPWVEPTRGISARAQALMAAVQDYLREAYLEGRAGRPGEVAARVLGYWRQHLAAASGAAAAEREQPVAGWAQAS